jgi:hypothetical protein
MKTEKCYLIGCDILDDELSLGELALSNRRDVAIQANILINTYNFPASAYLCEDCFWK